MFGVSKATVCIVVKEVCAAVLMRSYSNRSRSNGFENDFGFPQCAGVVDGHLNIVRPIITIWHSMG